MRRIQASTFVVTTTLLLDALTLLTVAVPVCGWNTRRTNSSPRRKHRRYERRSFISTIIALPTVCTTTITIPTKNIIPSFSRDILTSNHVANAAVLPLPFGNSQQQENRIQLELCLVNLLRLKYWTMDVTERLTYQQGDIQQTTVSSPTSNEESSTSTVANNNNNNNGSYDTERVKSAYLEARLGAKVIVASKKKIGGGAGANVFLLKSLQIKECLDDLKFYLDRGSNQRKVFIDESQDLIEALASVVEFDGLETTQDPSPRSSLTLGMYNAQKGMYVRRMLSERVIPLIDSILTLFGPDAVAQTSSYVEEFYPKEVPARLKKARIE